MVMCRNSLDSAIVEAVLKGIRNDNPIANATKWDSRKLFGDKQDFFSVWMKVSDIKAKRLLEKYALNEMERIKWGKLRQLAVNVLKLDKPTIKEIEHVREAGNYSAHLAQNIIKSYIKSIRSGKSVKVRTSRESAENTIKKTKDLLEVIAIKYLENGN